MKIDLSKIDRENFIVDEHIWNGETLYLVIPNHIGAKWDVNNLIFRSSVWNSLGEPVSLSFKKFFNFLEHPELTPVPMTVNDVQFVTKMDGSTLIFSSYKNKLIVRTHGTIDATLMELNGHEIQYFLDKYPTVQEYVHNNSNVSLLFEWVSPLNRIIIDYTEADIILIGAINHEDYSNWTQDNLDVLAKTLGVKRPEIYKFDSIDDCINTVKTWTDKEGICIYSEGSQYIRKTKADLYLRMHRFKSEASLENTLELYLEANQPSYQEFESLLITQFDYECFNLVRGFASTISDAKKEVGNLIDKMIQFVEPLKSVIRKDAAIKITSSFGTTGRSGMCFTILDGKPLTIDQIRKLYWQFLKK